MKAYLSRCGGMGRNGPRRLGTMAQGAPQVRQSGDGRFGGRIDQAAAGASGIARCLLGAGRMQLVRRFCIRHLADLGRRYAQGRAAPARRSRLRGVHRPSAAAGCGRGRRCRARRGGPGRSARHGCAGGGPDDHRHGSIDDGVTSGQCAQRTVAAACLRPGGRQKCHKRWAVLAMPRRRVEDRGSARCRPAVPSRPRVAR